MLASDLNNPQFLGPVHPDSLLHARFYTRLLKNDFLSEKQGKDVSFKAIFVEISTPGNNLNIVDVPMREDHKFRFPRQWAMFEADNDVDEQIVGTPLSTVNFISKSMVEELKVLKFLTVEQIANASDLQMQSLGMSAQELKRKAMLFLDSSKEVAVKHELDEIAKRDRLIADLTEKVNALSVTKDPLLNVEIVPFKKRGRPKKVKDVIDDTATAHIPS